MKITLSYINGSVFHRDDVTLEVLEFIIKLLLLFDTSSLFSTPEKLAEVEDDDIYNQCFGTQKG